MILKGQKRKLDLEDVEVSDPRSPMWESQRQFVFSVSLNKYQRSQELPEPSLRRSVLIANTLRQITLEKSGLACEDRDEERPSSDPSSRLVAIERESIFSRSKPNAALMACEPVASLDCRHSGESGVTTAAGTDDEDWGSMSTDSDFSLSAAISSILTALDSTIDGSTQAAQRTPLRSLENISGPSERGSAGLKQGTRAGGASWEQQGEEKAQENSAEAAKSSYLNDVTMEDLFQDVEASLLERDMGGTGIRSSRVGYPAEEELICYLPPFSPSSPHPFSLSLNSNLKCLPSFSSFSPLPSPPSPESASFSTQNQAREGFELEHLMEILVES
ncbi:PREDICTED: SERTA domain-containing protein 2-like [Cyprinodon variegatus]|uniref:SERTA domain-containing protein 2-like n=1 Tax=Cyprinodon variegatus TaxID=28743 RepID=UPI0007427217|nr:PREDICTED: SERTA domain-containing protein 2-like [Cyprinodon variegatus]XP_015246247.1 PREDICTED: SERTA domain-containing protein 2-like [Cyprinodon variegatus]